MGDGGPRDHDDELSRELRQRVGEEFRAEAEEGERLAELARLRGRGLRELTVELRDRGDRIRLTAAGRSFVGTIDDAGQDHCTLRTQAGTVEVAFGGRPVQLTVEEPHATDVPDRRSYTTTFRSRLRELEMDGREVEIGVAGMPDALRGRIVAVAQDHVAVDDPDARRWYLTWESVGYVFVPAER